MDNIRILQRAVKDITNLPKDYARLIAEHIDQWGQQPRPPGAKKLRGTNDFRASNKTIFSPSLRWGRRHRRRFWNFILLEGLSFRVGVYRILYEIDDQAQIITIYRVKHRRKAYR